MFSGLYLHSIAFKVQLKSSESKKNNVNLSKSIIRPIQNICTLAQIGLMSGKKLEKIFKSYKM